MESISTLLSELGSGTAYRFGDDFASHFICVLALNGVEEGLQARVRVRIAVCEEDLILGFSEIVAEAERVVAFEFVEG